MPYKDPARQREAQREHCRKKRLAALTDRVCERCGSDDELEFHHRDPEEKLSHRIWSWAWERIAKELEKCDVLCKTCHRLESAAQLRTIALARNPHGTTNRYDLGCRCAECSAAKVAYNRAHRSKVAACSG